MAWTNVYYEYMIIEDDKNKEMKSKSKWKFKSWEWIFQIEFSMEENWRILKLQIEASRNNDPLVVFASVAQAYRIVPKQ